MKAIYCVVLIAGSAALSALLPAPGASAQTSKSSKTDGAIELAVKQSYVFRNYLKDDDIKIESKNGDVTLTGIISEYFHKSLAHETVMDIRGVKTIDNRLEVKGSPPSANSDVWLRDKVKASLLFHRSVNAGSTEVDVKDGVVTLRGQAMSQAQKELTAEYAGDIEGAREVKNEMTVVKTPKKTLRTKDEKIDDSSITAQVKMALLLHRSTSGLGVSVATEKGTVMLNGKAANTAEKDRVTRFVKDINGVRKVKNKMTLK